MPLRRASVRSVQDGVFALESNQRFQTNESLGPFSSRKEQGYPTTFPSFLALKVGECGLPRFLVQSNLSLVEIFQRNTLI